MTTVQAVIPNELGDDLAFVANELHRSKSYIICQAIKNYIAEKLEEIEDNRAADEALRRINRPHRTFSTHEEMENFININCHD